MQQFKDLLQECVEFKLRLERQGCEYGFSWSGQGTRFREEQMRSLTGLSPANAMVFKSVWPMLWKATSDNCIVVEKEVVQLIEEPDPEPITTPDLLTEFSSPFT